MQTVSKTAISRHLRNPLKDKQATSSSAHDGKSTHSRLLLPHSSTNFHQDPSKDIDDESTWNSATQVGPKVYTQETMLWKNSTAYFKGPEVKNWTSMKSTGQWEIPKDWWAYLTGGEIRKK